MLERGAATGFVPATLLCAAVIACVCAAGASCGGAISATGGVDGGREGATVAPDGAGVVPDAAGDEPTRPSDAGVDWVSGFDGDPPTPPPPCPSPTFSPPDGTVMQTNGTVMITASGLPPGGNISYTTDGTNPGPKSPVYAGAIEISASVTFRAAAMAPGCSLSAVVVAQYTVVALDSCCPPQRPTLVPTSQSEPNDFLVAVTSSQGETVCYTEDGTQPTCNNGICTGTSQPYSAATRISINGSVTDPSTGLVTVTVIGCEAGWQDSAPLSQTYGLQAAPPALTGLDAGSPADASGFTPTIQSVTVASTNPTDLPTIHYTTDGTQPSCTTGQVTANPTTFGTGGAPSLPASGVQLLALTCKPGYLPSAVATRSW
jgi:hypothetical protein